MAGGYFPHSRQQASEPASEYSFSHLVPVRHWARDPSLRSWPVLLLIGLVCVPPIALVLLNNATEATIHDVAWIFAVYFAVAWMLLLGVIVRPQHVHRSMLATIAVIGIVTQAPIAIFLETKLHSSTGSLLDIFTIGVPEELAKAIPIVVVAWIWRKNWQTQTPRDYLFLGAVSGLVFGAAEVVHYFTDVLGSLSGNVNGLVLQGLTIQYIWRFLTDPIDHACWAGITGYFIGLAITGQTRKYAIGFIGIGIAAVLHGLNDWNPINAHPAWVLITLISVLLFLGYARAGALLPHERFAFGEAPGQQQAPGQLPVPGQQPAPGQLAASGHLGAPGQLPPEPWPGQAPAGAHGSGAPREPWWQSSPGSPRPASAGQAPAGYAPSGQPVHPGQQGPGGQPAYPGQPVPAGQPAHAGQAGQQPQTVVTQVLPRQPKPPPKPWWEQ
jgi:RsiW-degrading membrane proteinase PrsW (M82 family)